MRCSQLHHRECLGATTNARSRRSFVMVWLNVGSHVWEPNAADHGLGAVMLQMSFPLKFIEVGELAAFAVLVVVKCARLDNCWKMA